jgi:hypothetical protein
MVKVTEMVRSSRNGGCPAGHSFEGDLQLATGEVVNGGDGGMKILQGYYLADPDAAGQISLDQGEGIVVVPDQLILEMADRIRAKV